MMCNQTAGRIGPSEIATAASSCMWHAPGQAVDLEGADDFADLQHAAEVDAVRRRQKRRSVRRLHAIRVGTPYPERSAQ